MPETDFVSLRLAAMRGHRLVFGPELLRQRVQAGDDHQASTGRAADDSRLHDRRQYLQVSGWSGNTPHLMLREIEVYGPRPEVEMAVTAPTRSLSPEQKTIPFAVRLSNHSTAEIQGRVRLNRRRDGERNPEELDGKMSPGQEVKHDIRLVPPAGPLAAGVVRVQATVLGADANSARSPTTS